MWLILLAILFLVLIFCKKQELFGSSAGGAIIQLQAKGPDDSYLTTGTEKYWMSNPMFYPFYPHSYGSYYPFSVYPYDPFNPYIRTYYS